MSFECTASDYCDQGTARCRISPERFAAISLIVGQWVELRTGSEKVFCKAWPARFDCKNEVQIDRFVRQAIVGSTSPSSRACSLCPIKTPLTIAQRLEVSVSINLEGGRESLGDLAIAYEAASKYVKRNIIYSFLEGLVVQTHSTIGSPRSDFSVQTFPDDVPILVALGTQISIVEAHPTLVQTDIIHDLNSTGLPSKPPVTTLPGLEKAFQALLEVVSYPLLYPQFIKRLNIECPKGVLLYGPPGVGKTYLVAKIAEQCKARMLTIYGPDIFGPYVGESEEKLRQKFDQARRMALEDETVPIIIFIDELDALTPHRTDAAAHESRVVAQLLTLMDGVASRGRVVVVAATNRPNAIDPALRRPGRFDREVGVDAPDESARLRIINSLTSVLPLDVSASELATLARMTNGFVGADLEALCRESALNAVHRALAQGLTSRGDIKVAWSDLKTAFGASAPSLQRGYGVTVEPIKWTDIGGLDLVKTQLKQAVEWPVAYKATFERLGLKAPRGILLHGPPGCSKTTLVKVIASNSGASFLSVNGAALYSSFVGDSEKIIRQTFHQARLSAPSIIFFDEIDTIVGKRNLGSGGESGGGDSVQERVLSTLLNEMDGVENANGVLIVAASNRIDLIDKALLRPGRFDRIIYVPPPDIAARLQILEIYTNSIPLAEDVDIAWISKQTEMYTGADLQNLCREAAMIALRTRLVNGNESTNGVAENVTLHDFQQALDVVKASLTPDMLKEFGADSD